jgi:hypothetical protein
MSAIAPSTVVVVHAIMTFAASIGTAQPTIWDQSTDF